MISHPATNSIKKFQNLIYGEKFDKQVDGLQMSANEMANLCSDRWISSDHVHWLLDDLNISQKKLCVHINHALDEEAFVARSLPDGRSKPTSLFFALNVGKDSSGNVFIASGSRSGCHWTMCHVDRKKENSLWRLTGLERTSRPLA